MQWRTSLIRWKNDHELFNSLQKKGMPKIFPFDLTRWFDQTRNGLLLGVENAVNVTLFFSFFSYFRLQWNSIVTYTVCFIPSRNRKMIIARFEWINFGRVSPLLCFCIIRWSYLENWINLKWSRSGMIFLKQFEMSKYS